MRVNGGPLMKITTNMLLDYLRTKVEEVCHEVVPKFKSNELTWSARKALLKIQSDMDKAEKSQNPLEMTRVVARHGCRRILLEDFLAVHRTVQLLEET